MAKHKHLLVLIIITLVVLLIPVLAVNAFSLMDNVHTDCTDQGACNVCDITRIIYNVGRFVFMSMAGVALLMAIWAALNLILAFIDWSRLQIIKSIMMHTLIGLAIIMVAWTVVYMIMFTMLKARQDEAIWTAGRWYTGPSCERTGGRIVTAVPSPPTLGCAGIPTSGIKAGQCRDASPGLTELLNCIKTNKVQYATLNDNDLIITSISDDWGFLVCRDNYVRNTAPPGQPANGCSHRENSCHYGGPKKGDKSYAADLRSDGYNSTDIAALRDLTGACLGYFLPEDNPPHFHVSDYMMCGGY